MPRSHAGAAALLAAVMAASLHAQADWPGFGRDKGALRLPVRTSHARTSAAGKIPVLYIRDDIRGQRGKVPWGTGDTRIREVLQLLKREKYPIVAHIEYDYGGPADPWNEVKKCFGYCESALE